MTSIYNSMEKIKQFTESNLGKDVLSISIIIFVGLGSFGLGRLSNGVSEPGITVTEYNLANVGSALSPASVESIKKPTNPTVTISKSESKPSVIKTPKNYFGSSRGSKYYSIGCTGGKTLKEENKIWFASKEEAEKAGYELSSTCKQ